MSARSWPCVLRSPQRANPRPILLFRPPPSRLETPMNRAHARLLPGALVIALTLLAAPAGHAQFGLLGSGIVFDPSNFARNVLHYARRLEQMNLQRQQLQQQLTALRKLRAPNWRQIDRKSTRLNSSHGYISYAVFCLKKKTSEHP